jgi:trans-2,3-dihydro-3-hydroxyanthranilate isomerase
MSNQKRRLPFIQMDVFTAVPLEGNQLAVFTDARGLTDGEMQAIARETNLSETTFILPGDAATERERGVRVRIFTTTEEMPFAGHPTLGTAMVLHNRAIQSGGSVQSGASAVQRSDRAAQSSTAVQDGRTNTVQSVGSTEHSGGAVQNSGSEEVALDLNVGRIPVRFSTRDGLPFGMMTQRDPEFLVKHAREDVARATGLAVDEIADDLPIQTVSTGNAFVIVPVKSLAVLQKLAPVWANMKVHLEKTRSRFFYFVSRETLDPEAKLQARMIFYNGEDPATGSAAGPCVAWAVQYGVIPADEQVLLEQGVEMKRRSRIFFSAGRKGEKILNVRVGGHAVEVMRGELFL